jgi:2-(1,2-epoxy-1,2-dihydrophenyl)acetyl-CoA isomerase
VAGGDLGVFRSTPPHERPDISARLIGPVNRALEAMHGSDVTSIASVHGAVAGAGMSLATMADFTIAAEGTRFNFAYTKVAGGPDCGGSFALARLVGLKKALEIALLCDTVDAKTALALGLVNRVVTEQDLHAETMRLAQRLRDGPRRSLGSTRRLLQEAWSRTLSEQLRTELENFAALSGRADFQEGLDAFFEKRAPQFKD